MGHCIGQYVHMTVRTLNADVVALRKVRNSDRGSSLGRGCFRSLVVILRGVEVEVEGQGFHSKPAFCCVSIPC